MRVNRNYVLTKYVLNENDCVVFISALCVFLLPPARIDLKKKKTNEKH